MKFIRNVHRNNKLRERLLDALSKVLLIGFSILVCLWMISGAQATPISITGIKTEVRGDGAYIIDFQLSQKLPKESVSVEFDRNFIQLSLKGVSAYPARTETINQSVLDKVFTYQYQPDLARARVLLKASASTIKGKASWENTDEGVRITVKGVQTASRSAGDSVKSKAAAAKEAQGAESEEERVVKEILAEGKGGSKPAAQSNEDLPLKSDAPAATASSPAAAHSEEQPLFSNKANGADAGKGKESPATRVAASLLLVIGIIGACAVGYRRFALGKGIGLQKQGRVIEVVASQGVGPKRSIALIKVLDQYMVVGMAGDSMNLLANLGSDVKIEKFLDQVGGPGASFGDLFEGAMKTPASSVKTDMAGPPITHKLKPDLGIRSAIKKRMEGFKPL